VCCVGSRGNFNDWLPVLQALKKINTAKATKRFIILLIRVKLRSLSTGLFQNPVTENSKFY
jgi:hypothetical protein